MNLQQLEYIVALSELKNFSRAAERCHITQATLSAMVKKLEKELDVVIFDRKTSPIVVTDLGKEIVQQAKKVLLEAQELKNISKNNKEKVEGSIIIGIIPTVANALLPKILKKIIQKYPQLICQIREITTQSLIKELREGRLDVGILATPLNIDDIEENVLYYEMLMVYGTLENDKKYLLPEELKEHKIWMLEEGHCLREQIIQLCSLEKKKEFPENFTFEANSFDTLLNIVDDFGGLTLIPELYYQSLPQNRKQKVSFFQSPIPVREISLVYFRPFAKYRIIHALVQEIKAIVSPELMSGAYPKHELSIVKS
ncbi:MAG: LysR substrate-binding domain-containing protein [Raineya sp.]